MSKGKRLIILCLVMVAAIAGFVIAHQYRLNNPIEEESSFVDDSSVYEGHGSLVEYETHDIETIHIVNAEDDFTLKTTVTKIDGEDESADAAEEYDVHWDIVGHEEWVLDGNDVDSTVSICTQLFANRLAAENSADKNLADFGLDKPCSTITVTYYDGTSQTVYIGNATTDNKFCYGMVEGDDAIYTFGKNALDTASFTAENLRHLMSLSTQTEGEIWYLLIENANGRNTEIKNIGIDDSGENLAYYNPGTWSYGYGEGFAYPDVSFAVGDLETVYQAIPQIQVTGQVEDDCQDLDQYGLGEKPEHHVILTYRVAITEDEMKQAEEAGYDLDDYNIEYDEITAQNHIYVTNEYFFGYEYTDADGNEMVYFRYADTDDVLGVKKELVDQFEFDPFPYVQKVIYMNAIDNFETINLTIAGEEYELTAKRGEVTVDEDGKEQQPVVYRINDQLVDTEAFTDLYIALIGVMADYEIYNEVPEMDKADSYSIDYTFLDGSTKSIDYYRHGDFYYVTQVADDAWFACRYTQFEEILRTLDVCLNGEAEAEE